MQRQPSPAAVAVLAAFCLVSYLYPAAAKPRREADSQALRELEEQWLHASDAATLERILAPDFIHVVPAAVFLTKPQHIAWFRQHPPPAGEQLRFERLEIRFYDQVGIVNGIVAAGGAPGKAPSRTAFTDVFAYRDGRWQAVNGQENRVEQTPPR
jgi:hypothetical protein